MLFRSRSRNSNLYAGLVYDAKTFQDKVDTSGVVNDKKAQVVTASVRSDVSKQTGHVAVLPRDDAITYD